MPDLLPIEINVQDVKQLIDNNEDFLFLDCREPHEYEYCHLDGTRLIPVGQIPAEIGSLQEHRERRVVVMCHHGNRSLMVARWMRDNGLPKAQSMAGGIEDWSLEVDSAVPRY